MTSQQNQSQTSERLTYNELDDARIQSNPIIFTPESRKHVEVSQTESVKSRTRRLEKCRIEKWGPGEGGVVSPRESVRRLDQQLENQISRFELSACANHKEKLPKCRSIKLSQTVSVKKLREAVKNQEICSICLNPPDEDSGKLLCGHKFCFSCIQFCARDTSNKCPYCRKQFTLIIRNDKDQIKVQPKILHVDDQDDYLENPCFICGTFESIPTLLLCDVCQNQCCHIECDPRIQNDEIPEIWKCQLCELLEVSQQIQGLDITLTSERHPAQQSQENESQGARRYRFRRNRSPPQTNIASRTRSKTNTREQQLEETLHLQRGMMRSRQAVRRHRN